MTVSVSHRNSVPATYVPRRSLRGRKWPRAATLGRRTSVYSVELVHENLDLSQQKKAKVVNLKHANISNIVKPKHNLKYMNTLWSHFLSRNTR